MFNSIERQPPDPILGLTKVFNEDVRAEKIDLGVGVYRNADGRTPIMRAVELAESAVQRRETTKAYCPPIGVDGFAGAILELCLGKDHEAFHAGTCAAIQTPGGCGALRLAGELIKKAGARRILVGDPTWPNHIPLLTASGLVVDTVPYYDPVSCRITFDPFFAAISELGSTDVLLVHGPCHNPTGADLSQAQIDAVIEIARERSFLLLIDTAYHGLAQDLEKDSYIIRRAAERLPEALVTYSCSKNFGLYRERTGALVVLGENANRVDAVCSQLVNIARSMYSMPPAHGGLIVNEILRSKELDSLWRSELDVMCAAINTNRCLLSHRASEAGLGNFCEFLEDQKGMFSLLPLSPDQVKSAREKHGIYMVGQGRINLCGVTSDNVDYLLSALGDVLHGQ